MVYVLDAAAATKGSLANDGPVETLEELAIVRFRAKLSSFGELLLLHALPLSIMLVTKRPNPA